MITIKQLAEKYNMKPTKARRILRDSGIRRKKPQWKWKEGTKGLERIENILKDYQEYSNQDKAK